MNFSDDRGQLRRLTIIGLFCLGLLLLLPSWSYCQDTAAQVDGGNASVSKGIDDDGDSVYYYAYLESRTDFPPGPIATIIKAQPWAKHLAERTGGTKFRPMAQWFHWANKRQKFLPAIGFILLMAIVAWTVFQNWLASAEVICRQSFWRSFFWGAFVGAVALLLARSTMITLIGWPLAIGLTAVYQALLICGLSVSVSMIGKAVGMRLNIEKWPVVGQRQDVRRLTELLIGSVILACLLQIPGPGQLPRIGTRLVCLFAVVGLGGMFRAHIASRVVAKS